MITCKGPFIKDVRKVFRDFGPPSSPLSAFHAIYQYCSSTKFGDFSTPLPLLSADVICECPLTSLQPPDVIKS